MVNVKDIKKNYTIQELSGNISSPLKKYIKKCVIEDEHYNNLIGLLLIQYMLWDFLGENAKIEILKIERLILIFHIQMNGLLVL